MKKKSQRNQVVLAIWQKGLRQDANQLLVAYDGAEVGEQLRVLAQSQNCQLGLQGRSS